MLTRRQLCALIIAPIAQAAFPVPAQAEPSASDLIAGSIVKIDAEGGRVTLKHEAIPYLHLPPGTTIFRYVDSRIIIGRRDGDLVRFRADRVDMTLRVTAIIPIAGR